MTASASPGTRLNIGEKGAFQIKFVHSHRGQIHHKAILVLERFLSRPAPF